MISFVQFLILSEDVPSEVETLAKKHESPLNFAVALTKRQKKEGTNLGGKMGVKGAANHREAIERWYEIHNKSKENKGKNMKKSVIEYFDTYFSNFGGELNESTTNDQIEQATLDLVNLTEEVLLFVEKILPSMRHARSAVKKAAATKVAHQNLKKTPLPFALTPNQRQRNKNREMAMKTSGGKKLVKHIDSGGYRKDKKAAEDALRSSPGAASPTTHKIPEKPAGDDPSHGVIPSHTVTKPSVAQDALARGKEIGKKNLERLGSAGRDVHRKVKGPDASMPSGIKGVKSQAPSKTLPHLKKAAPHLKKYAKYTAYGLGGLGLASAAAVGLGHLKDSVNHDEEEYQDHEKMRISQKLLNLKTGQDWKSREKESSKERREKRSGDKRYFDNIITKIAYSKQPHKQKSLVSVKDREVIPFTDKGSTDVSNIDAMRNAPDIADIIKTNKKLHRKQKEKGQGKLFK